MRNRLDIRSLMMWAACAMCALALGAGAARAQDSGAGNAGAPGAHGRYVAVRDSLRVLALTQFVDSLYADYPDSALHASLEAVEIARSAIIGGPHPDIAKCLGNAAWMLGDIKKTEAALELYREQLGALRTLYSGAQEDVALCLNNIGFLCVESGRLSEARTFNREALAMWRELYTGDNPYLATSISNFASFLSDRGEDAEAEPLLLEALAMRRRMYPNGGPQVAVSLNNLGVFCLGRGRYADAGQHLTEALAQMRTELKSDHTRIALALNNLAGVFEKLERFAEAERFYRESLDMQRRMHRTDDPDLARGLNNLGSFFAEHRRYDEAAPLLRESLAMYRRMYSGSNSALAASMVNMARLDAAQRRDSSAEALFAQALDMRASLYDIGHPTRMSGERHFAEFLADRGRPADAIPHYRAMLQGCMTALRRSFDFESERRQLEFLSNELRPAIDAFAAFCVRFAGARPSLAQDFFDALLHFRGAVAGESARHNAQLAKNAHALEVNARLTALRERDAAFASRVQDSTIRAQRSAFAHLADSLEARLRSLDREYAKLERRSAATWRDVQRVLRSDEAVVAYALVPLKDSLVYAAIVLRSDRDPLLVPLCPASKLDPHLTREISSHDRGTYITDEALAAQMAALVWVPLSAQLQGIRTVDIIPDGMLHRCAFGALRVQGGAGMETLDESYELHIFTSALDMLARDAMFRPIPLRSPQGFMLFGDPDFSAVTRDSTLPSQHGRASVRGWQRLPGTAEEVRGIAGICDTHSVSYVVRMGATAREDSVRALSGHPPRVLHLATHGFFFDVPRAPEGDAAMYEGLRGAMRGGARLRAEDNPMLRAGLVFAGVNTVWNGTAPSEGANDGILTALEISRLDLTGTELVTLSACETGLGDIENGEGIFGLQRAFRIAGAQILIMSLWKVPDEATSELMRSFYAAWLDGASRQTAWRKARAQLRSRYPEPWCWAAFVLVGE